jgi:hypothetical protein
MKELKNEEMKEWGRMKIKIDLRHPECSEGSPDAASEPFPSSFNFNLLTYFPP